MRILICGDRNGIVLSVVESVLNQFNPSTTTIVHGGCRGVDTLVGEIAEKMGFTVEVHPAQWSIYGKSAGPIRNREMVDSGIDHVLAFHPNIDQSKGTKDTVKYALKVGVSVYWYKPDGSCEIWI